MKTNGVVTTFILLQTLIDKTGSEHALQNGKEMDLSKRGDSLFIVRTEQRRQEPCTG